MSQPSDPIVTVAMAAYNAGPDLRASIDSVLAQSLASFELVVVDDGSSDGSVDDAAAAIDDPRVRFLKQDNAGKSVALNRIIDEMRGKYFALNDADDLSAPTRLERLVHEMERRPELGAVFSGHDLLIGDKRLAPRRRERDEAGCRAMVDSLRMPAHDPTVMFRAEVVRAERFDPAFRIAQGYDHIMRVGERWPMRVVGEVLYSYRVSFTSNTKSNSERREAARRRAIERACERRGVSTDEPHVRALFGSTPPRADNNLWADFIDSVLEARERGYRSEALATGLQSVRFRPGDRQYYKALVYALAPMRAVRGIRRRRSARSESPREARDG